MEGHMELPTHLPPLVSSCFGVFKDKITGDLALLLPFFGCHSVETCVLRHAGAFLSQLARNKACAQRLSAPMHLTL